MAVAIDSSSPAIVNGTGTAAITTASFTPPNGSMVVAVANGGFGGGPATATISDSLSGTWTSRATSNNTTGGNGGVVQISTRTGTGSAMTVTCTYGGSMGGGRQLAVYVLTGADTSAVGANKTASFTGSTSFTASITTTTNGALVVGGADAASSATTASLASNTAWATMTGTNPVSNSTDGVSQGIIKGSSTVGTPGATTMGVTWGASQFGQLAFLEIKPSSNSNVSASDSSGVTADSASVSSTPSVSDTGSGADTGGVSVAVASGDTGTGSDTAPKVTIPVAETASSSEATKVLSGGSTLAFASDSASLTESVGLMLKDGDTGSSIDPKQTATVGIQGPLPPGPRIARVAPATNG